MANGQNSLLEVTRSLRLYVPELPIPLAEQFIRDRYRKILERRDWSATRREAEFHLRASKSDGAVSFTQYTAAIAGTGTSFTSGDIGRQFKAGSGSPVYTITDVDVPGQILTLDRTIGVQTSVLVSYYIMDAYVTPPEDFLRFVTVVAPLQAWRLRHWVTQDELNTIDPQRTFFGNPYIIADRMYSAAGLPQYEAWPYTTTFQTLYYIYITRPADLVEPDDEPIWPIRTDILVTGALADVARWPGTREQPNPYFSNPNYWKAYEAEFEDKMIDIERRDEDVFMSYLQSYNQYGLAPFSASWLQSHCI